MLLALLLLLASNPDAPRPGPWPPQGYACLRAAAPLVIDGVLDEYAWQQAPWTQFFVDIEASRDVAPRFRTRARMLWDDTYFYVAAELQEPHLWATLRKRDSIIFHDNDFEVFLDPDGDSHLYAEIELNALNTVWDLLLIKPYRDGGPAIHAWDIPGLQTAVGLQGTLNEPLDTDTGWTVEMAIPFAVLDETTEAACPPRPGDRWRVNFSRVQWHLDVVGHRYVKRDGPEDNWVWSAQREIAMHEPEHWGIVEFVEHKAYPVTAGALQLLEWHLRYASYQLAHSHASLGSWPLTFEYEAPAGAPPLDANVEGPLYWSDGTRYTLRLRTSDLEATLTEDGRFSWQDRKEP